MKADMVFAQTIYGQGENQRGFGRAEGDQHIRGSSGGASLHVEPIINISERYDSNILLRATDKRSDFVTEFRPGMRVKYANHLLDGVLTSTALGSVYARNSELNYVGGQGLANVNLDGIAGRISQRLESSYLGMITYYPEQASFLTPGALESDFVRGIQARRNNALNAISTLQGTYSMSPLTHLNASYSFQTMRFFDDPTSNASSAPIALFDTTVHSLSAGSMYQVLTAHSVGFSYQYRHISFSEATGSGGGFSSPIHGGMVTWKTVLSPEFTAAISPGVSVASIGADSSGSLVWTMRVVLQWRDNIKRDGMLSYSRGVYPSYSTQASFLVSDLLTATFSYRLSHQWTITIGANYAVNSQGGQTSVRFESMGATGTLRYLIYQGIFVSITGSHNDFSIENASTESKFDRQIGMLALSAEWN